MSILLYHRILPENHAQYVSPSNVLKEGITFHTSSNSMYMNVGKNKVHILEKYKPVDTPEWLNFSEAIGVDLVQKYLKAFAFSVFTNRILVFDGDIASNIYDQEFFNTCSSSFEEAEEFDTGMNLDELYKRYWDSMIIFEEYINIIKYPNPQVLLFEPVPKDIIQIIDKKPE